MSTANDGSESVDQFLARIASVKEGRDKDDEDRTRRMEEDFLKNRKERQARRLERARSLSPSKTGPARSFAVADPSVSARNSVLNPPVDFSPQAGALSRSNAVRTSPKLEAQHTEPEHSISSPPIAISPTPISLARSGTLSWQQRPSKEGSPTRPRPLSSIATVRKLPDEGTREAESPQQLSRQDIAAALGSKDASWFRQTQDRGVNSAAYRKSHEDTPKADLTVRPMYLPGLSKEAMRSTSPAQVELPVEQQASSMLSTNDHPAATSQNLRPSESPQYSAGRHQMPLAAGQQTSIGLQTSSSPKDPTRSPSPTKGLGGFVQSAMMRRSDSVNKRWSVQNTAGLKRGDSVAGIRPLSGLSSPQKPAMLQSASREVSHSPTPISRPGSSHGATKGVSQVETSHTADDDTATVIAPEALAKRPTTPPSNGLARSPSRTTDPRRWSPTKSSWLESTLLASKESPKIVPKKDEQPQWMVNLQRTKSIRDRSPEKGKSKQDNEILTEVIQTQQQDIPGGLEERTANRQGLSTAVQLSSEATDREPTSNPGQEALKEPPRTDLASKPVSSMIVDKKPPNLKPKPQTPPKTDFRATLRSRAPTTDSKSNEQPEFKSVFSKLKSAQTQNYVAPDTLKTNIMAGKAALNVTDGPQKIKRVDEFKESILQKKEAMKNVAAEKKIIPGMGERAKPDAPVPEAIQRKKTLHRATSSNTKIQETLNSDSAPQNKSDTLQGMVSPKSAADAPLGATADKPHSHVPLRAALTPAKVGNSTIADSRPQGAESAASTLIDRTIVSKPGHEKPAQRNTHLASSAGPISEAKDITGSSNVTIAPWKKPAVLDKSTNVLPVSSPSPSELPANSKLASRLNPNLAAMLSRGNNPRPALPSPETSEQSLHTPGPGASHGLSEQQSQPAELTHMTKTRARGPKRRAPKAQPSSSATNPTAKLQDSQLAIDAQDKVPIKTESSPGSATAEPARRTARTKPGTLLAPTAVGAVAQKSPLQVGNVNHDMSSTPIKAKPTVAAKSPNVGKLSSSQSTPISDATSAGQSTTRKFEISEDKDALKGPIATPQKPAVLTTSASPVVAVQPLTPSKTNINALKRPAIVQAPVKPSSPKPQLTSSAKTPVQKAPISTNACVTPGLHSSAAVSPTAADKLSAVTDKFFSVKPTAKDKMEFDTPALLEKAISEPEKLSTVSNTIWELTGDGKKLPMPPQQEHILYEESMYLIVHVSATSNSNKASQVYLWCGDRVSESSTEDVQIFCKRDAREHNAKLEVIKQGGEPAAFFQALGGIVITRRSKSSALYMLCGRKHLGHIAFDEVELHHANLCSGFPYLISAKFGSLYLWKGKGSAIDEVGCARLIGMDLGLTGEIEEVDEGQEPASFWEAFPNSGLKPQTTRWHSAWHQRADHRGYPGVLYRMEQERPKSTGGFWGLRPTSPTKPTGRAAVEVLVAFSQRDLTAENVYILDMYHSVYVLLHPRASSRSSEVSTALHLAQEIALLSPSIQSRRLQPAGYVFFGSFEDLPRDVRACFRKWTNSSTSPSSSSSDAATYKLEDVMQALDL